MTTRFDDEVFDEGGERGDDPLAVILRPPTAEFLGPPPGRYEAVRRAATRRKVLRAATGVVGVGAVATLLTLQLLGGHGEPAAPPLAPPPTHSGSPTPAPSDSPTTAPSAMPTPVESATPGQATTGQATTGQATPSPATSDPATSAPGASDPSASSPSSPSTTSPEPSQHDDSTP